jgi:hypothetical protein
MAEPTLQQVFGAGATQTADTLTIPKSWLVSKGLTASANNTAESMLAALLMAASDNLTETARATDTVNRHLTILYSGQDLIEVSGVNYRRDAFSVLLYKQQPLATLDPDDY